MLLSRYESIYTLNKLGMYRNHNVYFLYDKNHLHEFNAYDHCHK